MLETKVTVDEILMDPELIEQVIINLLRNSLDAMEKSANPIIKIEAKKQLSGKSLIKVSDNGIGIDQETIENIFIPFFTTKKNGSGIGLALVKQIVQLHHGEIYVNSSVGKGAEFNILL